MAKQTVQKKWPTPFSGGLPVPQQQRTQSFHLTAPIGGINASSPASGMPPSDCLFLYNMIPYQYGLRVRSGWQEHCTGVGSDYVATYGLFDYGSPLKVSLSGPLGGAQVGNWPGALRSGVRSILSFAGSDSRGLKDRLFACTKVGIWDVTVSSAAPTCVYNFEAQDLNSGKGIATAFVNAAGDHYLAYCDGTNGYLLYSEKTDSWTKITQGSGTDGLTISGANPESFRHVVSWKNRLWFSSNNSATAYYLDIGAFAGTAYPQNFGARFKYGGSLSGLWNWTVDGGTGIDDFLVGISTAGDVVIYQGTDPATPGAFGLKGVWWVGQVPPGRRIASSFGGDLFILSRTGCLPLSKLVAGYLIRDPNIYATQKVANLFNKLMTERGDLEGWEINIHPNDNLLIINVPATTFEPQEQLTMSLASKGWSRHMGVPMSCMETWRGTLYFGTFDNRVCANTGYVDGMKLDGTEATPIAWGLMTSFQGLGVARKKRLHMVKPYFMTDGTYPGYMTQARWDFDLSQIVEVPGSPNDPSTDKWNVAQWNASMWGDGVSIGGAYNGATGMGTYVAIILVGTSKTNTTLAGFDAMFDVGGLL